MWILLILVTFASVIAFYTKNQRLSLLIITFLATSGFQLLSAGWFWNPFGFNKPFDYAYIATAMILVLNAGTVVKTIMSSRIAMFASGYMVFITLALLASILIFGYKPAQSVQGARTFLWPLFLLLFLITDKIALEKYFKALIPIIVLISVLYLLQPLTGKNIINPDSEYYNPYLGSTDLKRFLSTPDFLIFFLLYFYYQLCSADSTSFMSTLGRWLGFALLTSVQIVSFTRSAILGSGAALLYVSKRMLNSLAVTLFIASVLAAGAVAYTTSSTVQDRVDNTAKDIGSTLEGNFLQYRTGTDGNLSFRLAHLDERLTFVLDEVRRWPIGVGFIHEDSTAASKLGFKIGLRNPATGHIVQVDSGDIAWSVVVIKTGIAGLVILIAFLFYSFISVNSSNSKFAVIYRGGLLYYIVTSFFSANFVVPAVMMPLMLFLALAINEKDTQISTQSPNTKKFA